MSDISYLSDSAPLLQSSRPSSGLFEPRSKDYGTVSMAAFAQEDMRRASGSMSYHECRSHHTSHSSSLPASDKDAAEEDSSGGRVQRLNSTSGGSYLARSVRALTTFTLRAARPLEFAKPTTFRVLFKSSNGQAPEGTDRKWAVLYRSRDVRYGRNVIAISRNAVKDPRPDHDDDSAPLFSNRMSEIQRGIANMFTTFPHRNPSLWIAMSWEIGSDLFILCGVLVLWPHLYEMTEARTLLAKNITGWISFLGVFCYQGGAFGAMLMSLKTKSIEATYFRKLTGDWYESPPSSKQLLSATLQGLKVWLPFLGGQDNDNVGMGLRDHVVDRLPDDAASGRLGDDQVSAASFDTCDTWKALLASHLKEIGFLGNFIMFIGATVFLFNGIGGLPYLLHGVFKDRPVLADFLYWYPSDAASCMFLIASMLLTIETQDSWYRPQLSNVGWWVGAWSTIGSVGFLLCAVFGPLGRENAALELQSLVASLWGAICFRISSTLMHYEAVNTQVVEELWDDDDAAEFVKLANFLPFNGTRYQKFIEAEMARKAEEHVAEPDFRRNSWTHNNVHV